MGINWKVRFKNQWFWVSFIPAVLLAVQAIAAIFGFTLDLTELGGKLIAAVDAIFAVLILLGVVEDYTTKGLGDGKHGRSYEEPAE